MALFNQLCVFNFAGESGVRFRIESMDEIQSLKEKLKQAQLAYQMATEMSQFKAGFLTRTSHELRSPLSSLIGLHQLILSDLCDSPEEEREFITQAHTSALKLMQLIDEIIDVAKTEHGTNQLEIQPIQLAKVLEDVHRLTYLQAANRNLQIQIAPPSPEIYVMADSRRFLQALMSLVDAAIAHMEEGRIRVSTNSSPTSDWVQIWIDLQCSPIVWSEPIDLLQQVPELTPEPELSPGMKLLLSQTLIEVMQGRLEVIEGSQAAAKEPLTRLQCSMPLASAETVARLLKAD